ncbi:hypothetical protein GYA28_02595 [Candidatus Roizmanbacteria bacterium]|nr:hypothetical protein [Candidatus Roizmanbacteria bacterium]
MKVVFSAPAKVIVSGEHAVVYGKPALVSAIDLRLVFSLWNKENSVKDENVLFISKTVKRFLTAQKIKFEDKPFDFSVVSDIPVGRHLGSSAAFSVAGTAAFLKFLSGKNFPKGTINDLSYEVEKRFHLNPSGVDNSTVCFGGLIYYRKEFEFLKSISSLRYKVPNDIERNLFLIDTGQPEETTGEMVGLVNRFYSKNRKKTDAILDRIEKCTQKITLSLTEGNRASFMSGIVENQALLESLGVVSESAKGTLVNLSRFGVGKVTGGGGKRAGSGFIIFFSEDRGKLTAYLKERRIAYYHFRQDFKGLYEES